MSAPSPAAGRAAGSPRLGLVLTIVLAVFYFGFIGCGVFAPQILARPLADGGTVTLAFAWGLFVIALGVGLTGLYALLANREAAR